LNAVLIGVLTGAHTGWTVPIPLSISRFALEFVLSRRSPQVP